MWEKGAFASCTPFIFGLANAEMMMLNVIPQACCSRSSDVTAAKLKPMRDTCHSLKVCISWKVYRISKEGYLAQKDFLWGRKSPSSLLPELTALNTDLAKCLVSFAGTNQMHTRKQMPNLRDCFATAAQDGHYSSLHFSRGILHDGKGRRQVREQQ